MNYRYFYALVTFPNVAATIPPNIPPTKFETVLLLGPTGQAFPILVKM